MLISHQFISLSHESLRSSAAQRKSSVFLCVVFTLILIACSFIPLFAQASLFSNGITILDAEQSLAAERIGKANTTVRMKIVSIDPEKLREPVFVVELFDEIEVVAWYKSIGSTGIISQSWTGQLLDGTGSICVIYTGDRVCGKINSVYGNFAIYPLGDGKHVVVELDNSAFPECTQTEGVRSGAPSIDGGNRKSEGGNRKSEVGFGRDGLMPAQRSGRTHGAQVGRKSEVGNRKAETGNRKSSGNESVPSVLPRDRNYSPDHQSKSLATGFEPNIRVLVAYTANAQDSTAARSMTMQELIDLAVCETNQGYAYSGVDQRIELAFMYLTGYTDTGDNTLDVDRFQMPGDGFLDEVHNYRDVYDADMCCLITDGTDTSFCGFAYDFDYTDEANMFQVTEYDCATGNLTFGHEFGHNEGCRHNTDSSTDPFDYGHGYMEPSNTWRTIMGLNTGGSSANRLNYWSNPDTISSVSPFVAMGTTDSNDCARALNVADGSVIGHRIAPDTYSYADIVGNDETADKYAADELTVGFLIAQSGSRVTLRSDARVIWQPGFHAQAGSWLRSYMGLLTNGCDTLLDNTSRTLPPQVAENLGIESKPDMAALENADLLAIPEHFFLDHNYPNPFNPVTNIRYGLREDAQLVLTVYDLLGRLVTTLESGIKSAGYYEVQWNGTDDAGLQVASGPYIYKIVAENLNRPNTVYFEKTKKMMLLR